MDLAGIEPASESLSPAASPITVTVLTFPPQSAQRQAHCFSSFILRMPGQSLPDTISHIFDARHRMCECTRADGRLTPPLTERRQRLYLNFPVLTQHRETADGYRSFKTPVETSTSPGCQER